MKNRSWLLLPLAASLACTSPQPAASPSSPPAKAESAPRSAAAPVAAAPTPTPTILQRTNPDVVEDTPTYRIQRYRKSEYGRVDDRHIRSPLIPYDVEFFKEDADYYYVYTAKRTPEEVEAEREAMREAVPPQPGPTPSAPEPQKDFGMKPEDFEDITPSRKNGSFRLEAVTSSGLPATGMWRHSFVIADINGDKIPDIVSPPARLGGDPSLHIFLGDGHGRFARQKLTYTENGKPVTFASAYGGVAVGDIDGDGILDVAMAQHAAGLVALFGKGDGRYEIVRKGLPAQEFSTQAVVLTDVSGDGRLDVVASLDIYNQEGGARWAPDQTRTYLSRPDRSFSYARDALVDTAHSNCLSAWDYNGDGRLDVLTGSQIYGAVQILFQNDGNGKFSTGFFNQIEIHGFHFATAPGTFGKDRRAAFADAFNRTTRSPERRQAELITVYSYKDGSWTRHRVWRKKNGNSSLYALAMGDLDGDGLDDIVFPDSEQARLRVFLQQADGSFAEADESQEPKLGSTGQCVRLADLDGDGRLDVVLSKTYPGDAPGDRGGWRVWLNRK